MGHHSTYRRQTATRASLAALGTALLLLALAASAMAAPTHPRKAALDIPNLNHACGAAVDSKGDVFASSAGESKVKVFDPEHNLLTSIANANEPCGLAVDSKGRLYVSEQATGNVVRYTPNAFPFAGTPTYGAAEPIDTSGDATGISVDPTDDRLYVAKGDHVASYQFDGTTGQNEMKKMLVTSSVTGGSFTLKFQGSEPTGPIAYNAGPAQVQAALEGLSTIGAGNVSVDEGALGERSFEVTFTHALGSQDVAVLSADSSGLSGGSVLFGFSGEVQGFAFDGKIGEGDLADATAVAVYTYDPGGLSRRYLFVADSASGEVEVFSGTKIDALALKETIDGTSVPDSGACPSCSDGFGFGSAGASLAVDWATGHFFVYDDAHGVVDEFEANGHYLDQIASPLFADAEPSAIAVLPDRSAVQRIAIAASGGTFALGYEGVHTGPLAFGATAQAVKAALEALPGIGAGNLLVSETSSFGAKGYLVKFGGDLAARSVGDITVDLSGLTNAGVGGAVTTRLPGYGPGGVYVSAGSGPSAKLLAFGPLAAPSRAPLEEPLSHTLKSAGAVATDSKGNVYVSDGTFVRVYDQAGAELTKFEDAERATDLAVDSTGKVYVFDRGKDVGQEKVTYYTPTSYPPEAGTGYSRHAPPLVTFEAENSAKAIGLNPANDHLLVLRGGDAVELDSAANGSAILSPSLGKGLFTSGAIDIAAYGANGNVYIPENPGRILVLNSAGTEILAQINGAGSPTTRMGNNPRIAVDQSNGHVLAFDSHEGAAQEYDASGGFVAEFAFPEPRGFTTTLNRPYSIAIDNSGGPSDGRAYIAFDDSKATAPDVWAFGPLAYGEAPPEPEEFKLTVSKSGSGNGTVTSTPAGIDCGSDCTEEYEEGAKVTLTASPDPGSEFTGWSGSGCSGTGTCEVTMSAAKALTADFEEEEAEEEGIPLTVATEGTGSGTVASDKGTISCNPFCSDEYAEGTVVVLTATPAPGSIFLSWRYCDKGGVNGRQCTIAVDKAKTVKATFTTTHALEVSKAPGSGLGKVQSSPGGILCLFNCPETSASFKEGTKVTLKQTPAKHFHFTEWLGDCTGSGACELTMGADHEVQALFAEDAKHLLTLTKSGGGQGTVKSSLAGINCGATCSQVSSAYFQGEVVQLTATPGKGSAFGGWSGAGCSGTATCTVTVSEAKGVTAEFK